MRRAFSARCRTMFSLTFLYRDDIAQIMEILKPHCSTVKLIIGGNELDDALEMKNLNEPYFNWCIIKAGNKSENSDTIVGPVIELEINVLGIMLTFECDNKDALIDVKQQIGEIIKKRTGIIRKLASSHVFIGICYSLVTMLVGILIFTRYLAPFELIIAIVVSLSWLLLPFITSRFPLRKGGVYTRESTERA